jgi:hypothetical protein
MIDQSKDTPAADDILCVEIPDDVLEKASAAANGALFTEFAYCTMNGCPG